VRELVVHQRRPEGTVTVRAAFQVFTLPQTYFSLLSMSMERNKGKAEPLFAFYVRWRSCENFQEGEGGNACAALWKKMTPCMHARRRYMNGTVSLAFLLPFLGSARYTMRFRTHVPRRSTSARARKCCRRSTGADCAAWGEEHPPDQRQVSCRCPACLPASFLLLHISISSRGGMVMAPPRPRAGLVDCGVCCVPLPAPRVFWSRTNGPRTFPKPKAGERRCQSATHPSVLSSLMCTSCRSRFNWCLELQAFGSWNGWLVYGEEGPRSECATTTTTLRISMHTLFTCRSAKGCTHPMQSAAALLLNTTTSNKFLAT
jgi:hypothetical protein